MTTSLDAPRLAPGGKLDAAAIDSTTVDAASLSAALASATDNAHKAALAVLAGQGGHEALRPQLLALLDDDGLAGRAASWALAKLGGEGAVAEALEAIEKGGVVRRENGYQWLCSFVALHGARPGLADAMVARLQAENERAKSGRTGLGDQALRVLAVLGDERVEELAKEVIAADRFASRVEIDRLRKAMKDDGRDKEALSQRSGPWTGLFADVLVPAPEPEKEPAAVAPPKPGAAAKPPPPPPAGAPPQGAPAPGPIDWEAFLTSPEATALPPRASGMAKQLGALLEQLATRAVGVPLGELTGQELAALLLQIVPQSLPPQTVQAALSPEALHVYEAVLRWLTRTGGAVSGAELVDAIRQVRQQLREQVRRSGILDGPDYSDPAEA